ncbi:MAG: Lar family restriction alleviation protein [Nitratireductor sp.]|nr:Lar family restriction alleviation protein [Nitratireductor sp.]
MAVSEETKLLPCPFCGGEAAITVYDDECSRLEHWCGGSVCGPTFIAIECDTEREVADIWNARAALSLPAPAGDVGELIERLTKEEERMQRLWGACDEAFQKYLGTPAAFDINGLKHAVAGRDPVLTDAAAALRYQASRIEQLERERAAAKEVLRKHHRWHDGIGVVKFTEDGQEIELDLSAEYGDSTLHEETVEALK